MTWHVSDRAGAIEDEYARLISTLPRGIDCDGVPVVPGRWGAAPPSVEMYVGSAPARGWARLRHPFRGQA
jgi:hypothetical protein